MKGVIVALLFVLIPFSLALSNPSWSRKSRGLRVGASAAVRQVTSALTNQGPAKKPLDERGVEKVILVLQTRSNQIVVYSGGKRLLYSISTEAGIPLANQITEHELKGRFPELYDVVTGIAWAGM